LGFFKDAVEGEEGLQVGRDFFEEIGEAHFEDALTDEGGGDGDLFGVEFDVGRDDGIGGGHIEEFEKNVAAEFAIFGSEKFGIDPEAVIEHEAADEFAAEFYVGDLVFTYGDD
jgi:hypothetical protein